MRDMGEVIGNVFRRLDPGMGREATPEEQEEFEVVLDAAQAWADGDLPLDAAAQLGTMLNHREEVSPAYTRYQCAWRKRRDRRAPALLRMCHALACRDGYFLQGGGFVTDAECDIHAGAIDRMYPGMNPYPQEVPRHD